MKRKNLKYYVITAVVGGVIGSSMFIGNAYIDYTCRDYNTIDPVMSTEKVVRTISESSEIQEWQFDKNYKLGVNKHGELIFINRDNALSQIRKDCSKFWARMSREFHLLPISKMSWHGYDLYDWQIENKKGIPERESWYAIRFLEIYAHSFPTDARP